MESGVNPFLPAKMLKVLFYGWFFFGRGSQTERFFLMHDL